MNSFRKLVVIAALTGIIVLMFAGPVGAAPQEMHIADGFLTRTWAAIWWAVCIPFWIISYRKLSELVRNNPETRMMLALSTAFVFVLSALKMPSVVSGSSSHPTGTALGAMLFGAWVMPVLATIVLIFQALLLAHGGITTLGANAFSMAIAGPFIGYAVYKGLRGANAPLWLAVFLGAFMADISTYTITSLQLAINFAPEYGFVSGLTRFMTLFAASQIPIAIGEGALTVIMVQTLMKQAPQEVAKTQLLTA